VPLRDHRLPCRKFAPFLLRLASKARPESFVHLNRKDIDESTAVGVEEGFHYVFDLCREVMHRACRKRSHRGGDPDAMRWGPRPGWAGLRARKRCGAPRVPSRRAYGMQTKEVVVP